MGNENQENQAFFEQDSTSVTVSTSDIREEQKTEVTERPDDIPEKFWDPEKGQPVDSATVIKSYVELEKSKGQTEESDDSSEETTQEDDKSEQSKTEETQEESEEKNDEAPLIEGLPSEFNSFVQEFQENDGQLSDESYQKLAEMGYRKELVDDYIGAKSAINESTVREQISQLHTQVGGEENWNNMIEWLATDAPADVLEKFNGQIDNPDFEEAKKVIEPTYKAYVDANGVEPDLTLGNTKPKASSVQPYESRQEMMKVINSPEYKSGNPRTHKLHEQRLMASDII